MGNFVRVTVKNGQFPAITEEERRAFEEAKTRPVNYEDIPEMDDERLRHFRRVHPKMEAGNG